MSNIIIASEKIKLYERLEYLCQYCNFSNEWKDEFWKDILYNKPVYDEFLFWVDKNDLLCKHSIKGYFITDIFVWEMRKFNVHHDRGKNYDDCDKTVMMMNSFKTMLDMEKDGGAELIRDMETKNGGDHL